MRRRRKIRTAERSTLLVLRSQAKHIAQAEREHLMTCFQCHHHADTVYRRCDEGWEIAKALLRARRKIEYYELDHSDKQEGLF